MRDMLAQQPDDAEVIITMIPTYNVGIRPVVTEPVASTDQTVVADAPEEPEEAVASEQAD